MLDHGLICCGALRGVTPWDRDRVTGIKEKEYV